MTLGRCILGLLTVLQNSQLVHRRWSSTKSGLTSAIVAWGIPTLRSSVPFLATMIAASLELPGLEGVHIHWYWALPPVTCWLKRPSCVHKPVQFLRPRGLPGPWRLHSRLLFGILIQLYCNSHSFCQRWVILLCYLGFNQGSEMGFQAIDKAMDKITNIAIRQRDNNVIELSAVVSYATFLPNCTQLVPCFIGVI